MNIILASASPQRKSLLEGLHVSFETLPSALDEAAVEESDPATRAVLLARLKAEDIHAKHSNAYVIGSDTLVVGEDGSLLEKPKNAQEARAMLELHSDAVSIVHSGLCVIAPDGTTVSDLSSSAVHFAKLTPEIMDWWIETGEWKERSGGFQIDGRGQVLIKHIEGDWTSIVGLPVFLLGQLFEELGAGDLLRDLG